MAEGVGTMPWAFVVRGGTILWAGNGFGVGAALDRLAGTPEATKAAGGGRGRAAGEAVIAATRLVVAGDVAEGAAALARAERDFPEETARAGYDGLRFLLVPGNAAAWETWERATGRGCSGLR